MIINNNKSKLRNATNTLANNDLFHFQTLQRVDDLQLGLWSCILKHMTLRHLPLLFGDHLTLYVEIVANNDAANPDLPY